MARRDDDSQNWGGAREGSGRQPTGRTARTLRATDDEWKLILAYADEVRGKKKTNLDKEQQKPFGHD